MSQTNDNSLRAELAQPAHTPEPWEAKEYKIYDCEGTKIGDLCGEISEWDVDFANAKRAVLCVNALAGISNEALESGALDELIKAANVAMCETLDPELHQRLMAALSALTGGAKC